MANQKLNIGIFDLTDCEGCEVRLLSIGKKFLQFTSSVQIINWRLTQNKQINDSFDIVFIEGTVMTPQEEKLVKLLREKAKIVVALGACACLGGVVAMADDADREKMTQYVYGKKYKPLAKNAQPLSAFIKVDYNFPGCPINPDEIENWLANLLAGIPISAKPYPVCYECKMAENECLLLNGQPCLGPITLGGCGAACPSYGIRCYGCWGPCEQANITAMKKALKEQGRNEKEIENILNIFLKKTKSYTSGENHYESK